MKKFLLTIFIIIGSLMNAQSDCISAIPVCGGSNLAYTPSGHGLIDEELGGCMFTDERFTVWYSFTIGTGGTLAFTINPNVFADDYDFAVYGPNITCGTVGTPQGQPIRCNYSGADGPTGLSLTVPGPGNNGQWSPFLNVLPGETYYLVVDNYSMSTNGFTLQWSGTATLNSPFNDPNIQPNPFVQPGPNADGDVIVCSNPATFDFSTLSTQIINGNPHFSVAYYENANDALTGSNPLVGLVSVNTATVYHYAISYTDPANPNNPINSCKNFGEINFVDGAITVNNAEISMCNNNNAGTAVFDLTSVATPMYDDPAVPVTRKYYPTMADLTNGTNEITAPYAYTSGAPGIVYVLFTTQQGCTAVGEIALNFFPAVVTEEAVMDRCFIPANPVTALFNLDQAQITNDPGVTKKFYPSLQDAINDTNAIPNPLTYISSNSVVYARVTNNQGCWGTAKITLNVIPPTYSLVLKDKIICVEDRTTLDAGPGFDAYEWSSGETTSTISGVQVGSYWVDLHKNGCITRQEVKVLAAPAPVITSIDITNNTVTVNAGGGTVPYQYSMDNVVWQTSNVFDNVPRGKATVYIKDAYDCDPIPIDITVPNLVNVITPNGDDINDAIDYSVLAYTKDLQFTVYDRYGAKVFVADKKNNFRWNGYTSGKKAPTGTYWYTITWLDPVRNIPVKYSGWVMLKNIE